MLGAAIFSFGIIHFNLQNNLAEGGFAGITLILFNLFDIPLAISNLVLNIPLFFIGWKILGTRSFIYTIIGTVSVSIFFALFEHFQFPIPLKEDLFLAALFAGLFIGVGLGICFRYGGTTGGVDIIARLAHHYLGWSMGKTMFMFDALVIVASILTYIDYKQAMYTLVAVFVGARVIDFMQEGAYAARGAMIISNDHEAIADKIMAHMDRGVTVLTGYGSYTKEDRKVLYCVVGKNEIVKLKNIITSVDPHAFVSVSHVHDVLGEGFTLDEQKKPYDQ